MSALAKNQTHRLALTVSRLPAAPSAPALPHVQTGALPAGSSQWLLDGTVAGACCPFEAFRPGASTRPDLAYLQPPPITAWFGRYHHRHHDPKGSVGNIHENVNPVLRGVGLLVGLLFLSLFSPVVHLLLCATSSSGPHPAEASTAPVQPRKSSTVLANRQPLPVLFER